ncbi:hypothetical protein [Mumia sp. Pv 4-285]|uniref:hypothetical protein n=1 Tax=Mumia qirimensis TaxID=3234852 RepID=UPI00351D7B3C
MRRPVTLSDRARGYGLWPGDVLASLPGARLGHVSFQSGSEPVMVVTLLLPADISPVADVPVRVVLTFADARVRSWRPSWRARLRPSRTERPQLVEMNRGRAGRYRLLHTAGRIVVKGRELLVDVVPANHLVSVSDDAVAS